MMIRSAEISLPPSEVHAGCHLLAVAMVAVTNLQETV